jgi:hypothetical protein
VQALEQAGAEMDFEALDLVADRGRRKEGSCAAALKLPRREDASKALSAVQGNAAICF